MMILIPVFLSSYFGDISEEAFVGWILVISFAFILIFCMIVSLFFIFAIIGAVKTYQGMEFRYPIVGHIVPKKSPMSAEEAK
jgi:uncharacterized Tic20 family protein